MFNRLRDTWNRALQTLIAIRTDSADGRTQLIEIRRQLDELQREVRLFAGYATLPPAAAWSHVEPNGPPAPGEAIFSNSTLCRQESFHEPYFAYWTAQLHDMLRYHRKLWEFVFICQALHERGMLTEGKRGLGFGVGSERLSAYFAGRGCRIVGTDLAVETATQQGWVETAQHAAGKEQLRYDLLCPYDIFQANVQFQPCDMNAIDPALTGFDFCWSACALEHLGSIEKGLEFIERSVDCLKPGGWAVHTTEFNLGSNDQTVDNEATVLFRQKDLEALAQHLEAQGHRVAPFDFTRGQGEVDRYIDVPPYLSQPHLTMALGGYATTSVGLIVQRKP